MNKTESVPNVTKRGYAQQLKASLLWFYYRLCKMNHYIERDWQRYWWRI